MRSWTAAALALALLGAALDARALDGWRPFSPPDAAFEIELPAEPTVVRKERWFPLSDFVSTVYTARVGEDAFGLNHTDLPRVALWAGRGRILAEARDGFLEDSQATPLSFEAVDAYGREVRELHYDIPAAAGRPALRGRARFFFESKRLYIVWAEVTDAIGADELERYFASLRVAPAN